MAQLAESEFASDHIIVKVHEGVEPTVLLGGLLSFTYGQNGPENPAAPLAEPLMAAGLSQAEWDTLMDCIVNGSASGSANCACWMEHYMDCHRQPGGCVEPGGARQGAGGTGVLTVSCRAGP
jgi:hypothetical protein